MKFIIALSILSTLIGCAGNSTRPQYRVIAPVGTSEARASYDSQICGDDADFFYGCMERRGYTLVKE